MSQKQNWMFFSALVHLREAIEFLLDKQPNYSMGYWMASKAYLDCYGGGLDFHDKFFEKFPVMRYAFFNRDFLKYPFTLGEGDVAKLEEALKICKEILETHEHYFNKETLEILELVSQKHHSIDSVIMD